MELDLPFGDGHGVLVLYWRVPLLDSGFRIVICTFSKTDIWMASVDIVSKS